jgi:hypothetical protein
MRHVVKLVRLSANGNQGAIMGGTEIGIRTLLLAGFDNIISMCIKVKHVLTSMGTAGLVRKIS